MTTLTRRDRWALVALILAWGINWPIMKAGVADYPPMVFRGIAMAGGLAVLWLMMRSRGTDWRVPRADRAEVIRIALFNGVIWHLVAIYAIKLLSSGRAAILGYTMPIWAALLGLLLYREHPSPRLWAGVAAAVVGVSLLLAGEIGAIAGRPVGTVLMLSAAVCWAYGTHLMSRRTTQVGLTVLTFWTLAISFAASTVVALIMERDALVRAPNTIEWAAIAFNAIVVFGFCQRAWFRLAPVLTPVASGLSVMLIPVIGLFSGVALLGEVPRWQDLAALGCVLAAMATVLLPKKPAPAGADPG